MLYLHKTYYEASPKAISRRTSYLRVRLEFLPYPHLIPTLFNGCGFGPPPASYCSFNLDMDRSPGFGSTLTDSFALLRLGFPSAPDFLSLTLPVRVTRRTVLQKVRGSPCGVPQLVNTGFQVLFHSPPGVLFTFPSQYYALSVLCHFRLRVRGFHPLWLAFPKPFC